MNAHKPTFKPSPRQRPLVQRLTPLTWVFIGVITLAVLLGVAGCVMTLTDRAIDEVWDPTATSTPVPTGTPVPTAGPSATSTVWYQEMETPTVAVTEVVTAAHPAWWSDQMTQDEEGNWWPPEEVDAMVKEHYQTSSRAQRELFPADGVPDLDAMEAACRQWYSGSQLEQQLLALEAQRLGDRLLWRSDYEYQYLDAQNWSPDGKECTLGVTRQSIELYGYDLSGQLVEIDQIDSQLVLLRMRYDPLVGHWKVHELVDFYNN